MMDTTKLPIRTWLLAIFLTSQAKTGLSSLALKRQLGTSCRAAWMIHQKVMTTMAQRGSELPLTGLVQRDDACLGSERRGVVGRGSPNKVPIVAAVSTEDAQHPMRVGLGCPNGFTCEAVTVWARVNLAPGCDARSNGPACFAGVIDAGCAHCYIGVGKRTPRELPQITWVNTALGRIETVINGTHKSFKFGKHARQYLGAFARRFDQRFNLNALLNNLPNHAATAAPTRERQIRAMAELHD